MSPIELKILKTYIKTNLANSFILFLMLPTSIFILFVQKLDNNLQLYIDYQDFNNFIIKNWYPLPLIGQSLDQLG